MLASTPRVVLLGSTLYAVITPCSGVPAPLNTSFSVGKMIVSGLRIGPSRSSILERSERRLIQRDDASFAALRLCLANLKLCLQKIHLGPRARRNSALRKPVLQKDNDRCVRLGCGLFRHASRSFRSSSGVSALPNIAALWQHPHIFSNCAPQPRRLHHHAEC